MNARVLAFPADSRDMPIQKPSEPLPLIFGTVPKSGFSTARRIRRPHNAELSAVGSSSRLKSNN